MNRVIIFLLAPWILGALGVSCTLIQFFFGVDLAVYSIAFVISALAVLGFNVAVGIWPMGEQF